MDPATAASLIQPPPTFLVVATAIVLTAFAILIALLILAWMVRDWRQSKPKRPPEPGRAPCRPPLEPSSRSHFAPPPPRRPDTSTALRSTRDWDRPRPASPYRSAPVSYTTPSAPYPPAGSLSGPASGSGISAGEGFLAGLAVGMVADGALRDEPAYTPPPSYDPPSYDPSPSSSDSGITYDSGSSGSDSSSSGDSGSSGGISFDW